MTPTTIYTYPLNGSTRDFSIPFEYLARRFVTVTLLGAERVELTLGTDYRFVSKSIIQTTLTYGSTQGFDQIEFRRNTSATERLVDFADGSILRAFELNLSQIQTMHIAEEARDRTGESLNGDSVKGWDARNRRIVGLSPGIASSDAATYGQIGGAVEASAVAVLARDEALQLVSQFDNEFQGDQVQRANEFDASQIDKEDRFDNFLASSGYQRLGDYAAGIVVTEYNQVILANGELWRLAAQSNTPYTTTGAGMPEVGAFVSAGDAVLRQELADPSDPGKGAAQLGRGVVAVNSVGDLLSLPTVSKRVDLAYLVKGTSFVWSGSTFVPQGSINPTAFGADPKGIADSAAEMRACAAYCVATGVGMHSNPSDLFLLGSEVDLRYVPWLELRGKIVTDTDGFTPIIAGYTSNSRSQNSIEIAFIQWRNRPGIPIELANLPAYPNLKLVGCKNTNLKLGEIDYVLVHADTDDETTGSFAYCNFYPQQIELLEFSTNPVPVGSTVQWINENKFFGGRIRRVKTSGTYGPNHNKFYEPTIETNGLIDMQVGTSNRFYGARFEGGGIVVSFGADTSNNVVLQSWTNTTRDGLVEEAAVTVIDSGVGNIVIRDQQLYYDRINMFSLSLGGSFRRKKTPQVGVDYSGLSQSGESWLIASSNVLYTSPKIPCTTGMGFDIKSDAAVWRTNIVFYDESGTQVTSASDPGLLSSASYAWSSAQNQYVRTTNQGDIPSPPQVITGSGYVSISLVGGTLISATPFKSVSVIGLVPKGAGYKSLSAMVPKQAALIPQKARTSSLTSTPYAAGAIRTLTNQWPGLPVNTPISVSFGNDGIAPDGLTIRAECRTLGVVTIVTANGTDATVTPAGNMRGHMVAHLDYEDVGTLAP